MDWVGIQAYWLATTGIMSGEGVLHVCQRCVVINLRVPVRIVPDATVS